MIINRVGALLGDPVGESSPGAVEQRMAGPRQVLAALPERQRLLKAAPTRLEPADNVLELGAGSLEGEP